MTFETGGGVPESWKTYRQALRDITISTQSIFSVTWPIRSIPPIITNPTKMTNNIP